MHVSSQVERICEITKLKDSLYFKNKSTSRIVLFQFFFKINQIYIIKEH